MGLFVPITEDYLMDEVCLSLSELFLFHCCSRANLTPLYSCQFRSCSHLRQGVELDNPRSGS